MFSLPVSNGGGGLLKRIHLTFCVNLHCYSGEGLLGKKRKMAKKRDVESNDNTRKTRTKGLLVGNELGQGFTSDNQPTPEAKSAGHQKKRMLKELAEIVVTGVGLENAKRIAEVIGLHLGDDEYTIEMCMIIYQIEKSMNEGDTRAFTAAMDRMRGKAPQSIDVTTGGEQLGSLKGKTKEELDELIKEKLKGLS